MEKKTSDLGDHCRGSSSGPFHVQRAIVTGNWRRSRLVHTPSAQNEALTHMDGYEPSPLLPFQEESGLSAACEKQNDLLSRSNTAGWDELMPSIGRSALGKALYAQTPRAESGAVRTRIVCEIPSRS